MFPGVYVCPSANLGAVYAYNGGYKYHACYWTNVAIRVNCGFGRLYHTWPMGSPGNPTPMDDRHSGGQARFQVGVE